MTKKYLLVLSRATSSADEAELNRWYNEVHIPEVMALDGFKGARRFRATAIQPSSSFEPSLVAPTLNYLALYELDDAERALASLVKNGPRLTKTLTSDSKSAIRIVFEEIFATPSPG